MHAICGRECLRGTLGQKGSLFICYALSKHRITLEEAKCSYLFLANIMSVPILKFYKFL